MYLTGCEVTPDVNLSSQKFCIKLLVPSSEGLSEVFIRADIVSLKLRIIHLLSAYQADWYILCRLEQ